jgi:hypothetical protein
MLAVQPKFEQ